MSQGNSTTSQKTGYVREGYISGMFSPVPLDNQRTGTFLLAIASILTQPIDFTGIIPRMVFNYVAPTDVRRRRLASVRNEVRVAQEPRASTRDGVPYILHWDPSQEGLALWAW